ncbi:MAG TPA: non-canonical purine NTP pyrophosphatase [Candidatus Gracilibacteria bacterium]
MKKILIATNNPGKYKELVEAFESLSGTFEFLSLADFPAVDDVEETGSTFESNALLKARYFGDRLGLPTLSDDSGFILEAYPEKFGVKTKRELNAKDDIDWMAQFIDLIEPLDNRRATFYCAMAFYDPHTKDEKVCLGQTQGEMMEFPQTPLEKGIPVSSIFLPDGETDVYSAMSKSQKNEISHRGKACGMMRDFLLDKSF